MPLSRKPLRIALVSAFPPGGKSLNEYGLHLARGLASHPDVAEVAVIGVTDERLGERVCACVVLRAGARLTLPELVAWLRDVRQVGIVKLPERLMVLQTLPRSPNNKVIKAELRAMAARPTAH